MTVGIIALPLVYLAAPPVVVAGVFALVVLNALALAVEPVLQARWAIWLVVLGIGSAELGTWVVGCAMSWSFLAVNDLVLSAAIASVANLWFQSGMRVRDAAVLGCLLTIYDFVATARLPLTSDLLARVTAMPFAPIVAWPIGETGQWVGLGLGDVLFAAVSPLVLRKAFGRSTGLGALFVSLGTLAMLLSLPALGLLRATFPVLVVFGPLMVAQYAYWIRRRGVERTMREYRQAEPHRSDLARTASGASTTSVPVTGSLTRD
jgi:hypothetical protein